MSSLDMIYQTKDRGDIEIRNIKIFWSGNTIYLNFLSRYVLRVICFVSCTKTMHNFNNALKSINLQALNWCKKKNKQTLNSRPSERGLLNLLNARFFDVFTRYNGSLVRDIVNIVKSLQHFSIINSDRFSTVRNISPKEVIPKFTSFWLKNFSASGDTLYYKFVCSNWHF